MFSGFKVSRFLERPHLTLMIGPHWVNTARDKDEEALTCTIRWSAQCSALPLAMLSSEFNKLWQLSWARLKQRGTDNSCGLFLSLRSHGAPILFFPSLTTFFVPSFLLICLLTAKVASFQLVLKRKLLPNLSRFIWFSTQCSGCLPNQHPSAGLLWSSSLDLARYPCFPLCFWSSTCPVLLVSLFKARQQVIVEHSVVWEARKLVSRLNLQSPAV